MEIIKKYKGLLVLALVVIVFAFSFFYRMYHNDVKALDDFVIAYERFDNAISDFSVGKADDSEIKAGDAVVELNARAIFSLSSLIKNDNVIPVVAIQVADLSGKELETLRAYKIATQSQNADSDRLAKVYSDLVSKRKDAYAHFLELAELKK